MACTTILQPHTTYIRIHTVSVHALVVRFNTLPHIVLY